MIIANSNITNMINSPVRKIQAKVELYEGSTLVNTFSYNDKLMDFTIERVCEEGKFFGFGICQHAKVQILDINREIDYITTGHSMKISYGVDGDYIYTHPTFHITQSRRDEKTNGLTIYGYDLIHPSAAHTVGELGLEAPYSIQDVAASAADFLAATGLSIQRVEETETCFATTYEKGANLEGTEIIREVLNDIAEATQTIYFVDSGDNLVFKRLSDAMGPDLIINKADYIELDTKNGRRLKSICHTTELEDNISASLNISGTTQYVRNNVFWEVRDDTDFLIDAALAAVGGMSICQFECSWRGNFLLELGDKITLATKDNDIVTSYVLDDVIEYNGTLQERTRWSYEDDVETESNPVSIGEAIKQTYAKVDKVNKEITLFAQDLETIPQEIASIRVTTDAITSNVQSIEKEVGSQDDRITDVEESVENLSTSMEQTAEQIKIEIKQELLNEGLNSSVTTTTGFTFNEEGLIVNKDDKEMSTLISEDGMTIYKDDDEMLVANNSGVYAANLRATTYLIIGVNSRFEDYDDNTRTGCFWIGEVNK